MRFHYSFVWYAFLRPAGIPPHGGVKTIEICFLFKKLLPFHFKFLICVVSTLKERHLLICEAHTSNASIKVLIIKANDMNGLSRLKRGVMHLKRKLTYRDEIRQADTRRRLKRAQGKNTAKHWLLKKQIGCQLLCMTFPTVRWFRFTSILIPLSTLCRMRVAPTDACERSVSSRWRLYRRISGGSWSAAGNRLYRSEPHSLVSTQLRCSWESTHPFRGSLWRHADAERPLGWTATLWLSGFLWSCYYRTCDNMISLLLEHGAVS